MLNSNGTPPFGGQNIGTISTQPNSLVSWSIELGARVSSSITRRNQYGSVGQSTNEGNNTLDIFVPSGSYVLGETHNYIISSSITGSFSEGKTIYTSFNTRMSHSLQGAMGQTELYQTNLFHCGMNRNHHLLYVHACIW